ncbi:hypothetical protein ABZV93_14225 [Actinopolymorpha sp. NPDC004070]|uniref:hypothetical protein n=1 Tax=Actinopolymorpha sp. NPDC004070 TaxID=3154548 RepID=UPI0033B6C33D
MLMHNLMLNDLAHERIADLHREVAARQLARLARKPRPCAPLHPAVRIPRQRGQARPTAHHPAPARWRAVRLLSLLRVRRYAHR